MISFTQSEIENIKAKAAKNSACADILKRNTSDLSDKIYIQKTALSTWSHYYVCPDCTVRLNYDYSNPDEYTCPACGKVFTGEPYKGGWWSETAYKNANGVFDLAVLYVITEDEKYLAPLKEILLGYAKYYPSYEVHGGIPYNKPGKLNSQVLDDSAMLSSFARAYDITKDSFTRAEQQLIENDLFICGANHLKENLTPQLHNHEVCICSTLGILGLVTENYDLCDFAVNHKYGLKYQIDNGFLADSLWFECSVGYHHYALNWFMRFECFARHTSFSLFADPHYRTALYNALVFPLNIYKKDKTFPKLNDNSSTFKGLENIYEYAYSYFKDDKVLYCLNETLSGTKRDGVYSLLYGEEYLPSVGYKFKNYLAKSGSQLAAVYGADERHLLFKATPYGGEHDHYDRLAVSFSAFGSDVSADMGTAAGYGAPLHYAYFKNTATHNSVCINGDNMPPAETVVNEYIQRDENDIYLDAQTLWSDDFKMPDSFTIKQWVDESYKDTKMRRIIQWYGKYFIDIFYVDAPNEYFKDWIFHIDGTLCNLSENAEEICPLSVKNPQAHLHSASKVKGGGVKKYTYDCGGFDLNLYALSDGKDIIFAKGPDNPSTKDISYILERTNDKKVIYVNVIEANRKGEDVIKCVSAEVLGSEIKIKITEKNGTVRLFEKRTD